MSSFSSRHLEAIRTRESKDQPRIDDKTFNFEKRVMSSCIETGISLSNEVVEGRRIFDEFLTSSGISVASAAKESMMLMKKPEHT